jgi:hypothetical protein
MIIENTGARTAEKILLYDNSLNFFFLSAHADNIKFAPNRKEDNGAKGSHFKIFSLLYIEAIE